VGLRRRGTAVPERGRGRHDRHQRADPGADRLLELEFGRMKGVTLRRQPRPRHRGRALLHPAAKPSPAAGSTLAAAASNSASHKQIGLSPRDSCSPHSQLGRESRTHAGPSTHRSRRRRKRYAPRPDPCHRDQTHPEQLRRVADLLQGVMLEHFASPQTRPLSAHFPNTSPGDYRRRQPDWSSDAPIVSVVEKTCEDWSFGNGVAQFMEGHL
jgi:hypothetical protein